MEQLIINGVPKYIKVYDNGGETFDRYTVIYTNKLFSDNRLLYIGMSSNPTHPQGFGQHGEITPSNIGSHLGKTITFNDLPDECKAVVLDDYKAIWEI